MNVLLDLCLTATAFIVAYFTKIYFLPGQLAGLNITPNYYVVLLLIIIIWTACLVVVDIYTEFIRKSLIDTTLGVLKATVIGLISLLTLLFIFKIKDVSRILLFIFLILDITFLVGTKCLIRYLYLRSEKKDYNRKNILIIGSRTRAEGAIGLIMSSYRNYHILGCLEIEGHKIGREVRDGVRVIGTMDDLKDIITKHVVDEVIFAMPLKQIESVDVYMLLIEVAGIHVRIFPDWHIYSLLYKPGISHIVFDDFHGIPTMVLTGTSSNHRDLLIKSISDYLAAILGLVMLLPFFVIIGICIKIFSFKGPVFFTQERIGLYGRKFKVYKFRTMVPDAEKRLQSLMEYNEADGPVFKINNDPRIIPFIGRFLRRTSLDELPQLINVAKGEMSLVGPRPPIQAEVEQYDVWQRRRLSMKPGLTCLWQIQPNRNDLSFHQWMTLDLKYIDNWSLKQDVKILWDTVKVVLGAEGR